MNQMVKARYDTEDLTQVALKLPARILIIIHMRNE